MMSDIAAAEICAPSASRWTAGQSVTRLLTLDYCVATSNGARKTVLQCDGGSAPRKTSMSEWLRWSKLSSRQLHPRCSSELECDKSQRNKLESVRRVQAGLQSFLSMRRIDARRKN